MVLKKQNKNFNILMLISYYFFYLFSGFAVLSAFFVIFSKNPVFSVLFLIFTFTNVSCLLFLFNFEFLPVIFLIVYVGAIAVLFLFVLMMLNIKYAELQENYWVLFPVIAVFSFVFLVEFMFFSRAEFFPLHFSGDFSFSFLFDLLNISAINIKFSALFGVQNNLKALAIALFTDYLFAFLLASFLLLLAMVAAIILTIYKSFVTKSQNIYGQIMANYDKSIVSYN